ncbi:MotA/TolQ/ExbB proton channel family protein [Croceibacterium ferulae]|uniref:MotA/TolQ/ExbB proton channel family protein n=1 Tax=Croceibacterium ferulae TaxID=1854641 RepID=UPI000EB32EC5|nr:MotA/TolQ/ExbB proton channel family protein [Croceibacterium ferulae]
MDIFDHASAALVAGGTLAATALRCGVAELGITLRSIAGLARRRFDPPTIRQRLAGQISDIDADGLIRARARSVGDGEFDRATDALIRYRSVDALFAEHARLSRDRTGGAATACNVLDHAAELAPVLGLAGTLLSLGGLAGAVDGGSTYADAIAGAVTTTLYGLVLAHFICAPLAAAITRRAAREDAERQAVVEWLARAVRQSGSHVADRPCAEADLAA